MLLNWDKYRSINQRLIMYSLSLIWRWLKTCRSIWRQQWSQTNKLWQKQQLHNRQTAGTVITHYLWFTSHVYSEEVYRIWCAWAYYCPSTCFVDQWMQLDWQIYAWEGQSSCTQFWHSRQSPPWATTTVSLYSWSSRQINTAYHICSRRNRWKIYNRQIWMTQGHKINK